MKVFNEEVNCCQDCPFLDHVGMDGEDSYCNKLHKDVMERSIDKDCPFNKPITKEVIEGFGFKLLSDKDNWCEFRNNKCDLYVNLDFQKPTHLNIHSRGSAFIGNCKPKVNNPIELEFILKSIGVIK